MIRLTFAFIMGLALGVLIRDTRQDWLDHEKEQKLTKQVRSCPYYWVTKPDGTQDCRRLMPVVIMKEPVPLRRPQ